MAREVLVAERSTCNGEKMGGGGHLSNAALLGYQISRLKMPIGGVIEGVVVKLTYN